MVSRTKSIQAKQWTRTCTIELPKDELAKVPQVCGSLRDALNALKTDHAFLLEGNVFSKDFIDAFIELKMEEVMAYETMPHPIEYDLYYSS